MTLPHLWIPEALARVEPVVKGRGGEAFTREDLAAHSRTLLDAFNRSAAAFADRRDFDIATDVIVQITTVAGWSVGKERQHLRNLGFEIVAIAPEISNVAIARIAKDALPKFSKKLDRYANTPKHIGKGNFGAIESITPVGVERKIEPSLAPADQATEVSCLITIFGSLSEARKQTVASRLVTDLRESGKEGVRIHNFVNGAVAVTADLTRPEMQRIGEQYMFVRTIESNGQIVVEAAVQAEEIPQIIQVERVRCQTPVAVIDSGVNAGTPLLAGLVLRSIDELPAGSTGPHMVHGTFVASRVVYGDDITSVLARRARPWCPIIDIQVTGRDAVGNKILQRAADLAEILQRIVPTLAPEAKVFNLSLGLAPIVDGRYSAVARLIDYLSHRHKVLFVISAGNIYDPIAAPPSHYLAPQTRVYSPAESLLSLTVGSIAKFCDGACVAREQEIAPYSRRGPGADLGLKPELAAHGGNVLWNGVGWTTTPRMAAYGLSHLGTHLAYAVGTSYAAPLVSQFAARLFDAYPNATPNLVRALLCHFTQAIKCPAPGAPVNDHDFCGFGEPNIDGAMFASEYGTAYLYSGSFPKDHYIFIPFHVPQALVDTPGTRLTVRGTVVFDPPVSLDGSADYSFCRIAGLLRKRDAVGLRDVPIGGDDDDARYPWNPLLQFRHSFRKGYAAGDWELRLRLITRGELPADFQQSFSVVIEVVDEGRRVDVRDAVVRAVQAYTPVQLRVAA